VRRSPRFEVSGKSNIFPSHLSNKCTVCTLLEGNVVTFLIVWCLIWALYKVQHRIWLILDKWTRRLMYECRECWLIIIAMDVLIMYMAVSSSTWLFSNTDFSSHWHVSKMVCCFSSIYTSAKVSSSVVFINSRELQVLFFHPVPLVLTVLPWQCWCRSFTASKYLQSLKNSCGLVDGGKQ